MEGKEKEGSSSSLSTLCLSLLKDYRQMKPIQDSFQDVLSATSDPFSIVAQKIIYEKIILDPVCLKYPPSKKYRKNFISRYIQEIERYNREMHEELLQHYLGFLSGSAENEDTCFKTFEIEPLNGKLMTIKVSIQYNLVGFTTWEAGFFLTEYFLQNRETIRQNSILELGSGVGFTSIALAQLDPKKLIVTDFAPSILELIEENFKINGIPTGKNTSVQVETLDWRDVNKERIQAWDDVEVIIAADCVYDPSLIIDFVNVITLLLSDSFARKRVAYVASTKRNEKTFSFFEEALREKGLEYSVCSPHITSHYLPYAPENIFLHQICSRKRV